jgi:hypothetical protein
MVPSRSFRKSVMREMFSCLAAISSGTELGGRGTRRFRRCDMLLKTYRLVNVSSIENLAQ